MASREVLSRCNQSSDWRSPKSHCITEKAPWGIACVGSLKKICVCLGGCKHVCVHICMHVCRTFYLIVEGGGVSPWEPELINSARLAGQPSSPRDAPRYIAIALGFMGTCHHSWVFFLKRVLGIELMPSCLHGKHFAISSILPPTPSLWSHC